VVSVLDSGAEVPGFKSQSGNSLRQTVHTYRASVHQSAKLVAALLRVAWVTFYLFSVYFMHLLGELPPKKISIAPPKRLPNCVHEIIFFGRDNELQIYTPTLI